MDHGSRRDETDQVLNGTHPLHQAFPLDMGSIAQIATLHLRGSA